MTGTFTFHTGVSSSTPSAGTTNSRPNTPLLSQKALIVSA